MRVVGVVTTSRADLEGLRALGRALDERLVVKRKLCPCELLFQAIRNSATVEPVLQTAVDTIGHGVALRAVDGGQIEGRVRGIIILIPSARLGPGRRL
jgi:hypothetical protein